MLRKKSSPLPPPPLIMLLVESTWSCQKSWAGNKELQQKPEKFWSVHSSPQSPNPCSFQQLLKRDRISPQDTRRTNILSRSQMPQKLINFRHKDSKVATCLWQKLTTSGSMSYPRCYMHLWCRFSTPRDDDSEKLKVVMIGFKGNAR